MSYRGTIGNVLPLRVQFKVSRSTPARENVFFSVVLFSFFKNIFSYFDRLKLQVYGISSNNRDLKIRGRGGRTATGLDD